MPFDASIGGTGSTSYASVEEADAYFALRLYSTEWTALTSSPADVAKKQAALVTATRRIDEESFEGVKASTSQALKWPRYDVADEDGFPFASTALPAKLKEATFMCALEILKTDFLQENYLANYSYLQNSSVSFKQFQVGTSGKLPDSVTRLLRGLVKGFGGQIRLVRG